MRRYIESKYLLNLYKMVKELNNDVLITLSIRFNIPTRELLKSELIKRYLEKKRKW